MRVSLIAAAAAALVLAGACSSGPEAPTGAGVCWHMVQQKDGKYRFNQLATNQPDLEHCAAQLEIMRVRFNRLGAQETAVTGAYQGRFIFIDPRGVFTGETLDGTHYPALVRTGDGRLAVPGAVRQQ